MMRCSIWWAVYAFVTWIVQSKDQTKDSLNRNGGRGCFTYGCSIDFWLERSEDRLDEPRGQWDDLLSITLIAGVWVISWWLAAAPSDGSLTEGTKFVGKFSLSMPSRSLAPRWSSKNLSKSAWPSRSTGVSSYGPSNHKTQPITRKKFVQFSKGASDSY